MCVCLVSVPLLKLGKDMILAHIVRGKVRFDLYCVSVSGVAQHGEQCGEASYVTSRKSADPAL